MKVKAFFMLALPVVFGLVSKDRPLAESGLTNQSQALILGQLSLHC
jgi:hypothetical protein